MNDIHIPSPCRLTNTQCNFQWVSKSRVTPESYHSTLSLRDNHDRLFSFRVTPDSYHSTLSLRDNHDRVFSSRVTPNSYHSTLSLHDNMTVCFLSRAIELFGLHCYPLTSSQKFRISPRVSYTHTEILDISMGLLHPHRNFGYLHGSLTPTQKFRISPRVSYTHTKILDFSTGLLHPYRNSR